MTVLDLVKHAVKTVVHTLTDKDRLAIVVFDEDATIKMELTAMNDQNKQNAIQIIEQIKVGSTTNIWAGLKNGLKILRKN